MNHAPALCSWSSESSSVRNSSIIALQQNNAAPDRSSSETLVVTEDGWCWDEGRWGVKFLVFLYLVFFCLVLFLPVLGYLFDGVFKYSDLFHHSKFLFVIMLSTTSNPLIRKVVKRSFHGYSSALQNNLDYFVLYFYISCNSTGWRKKALRVFQPILFKLHSNAFDFYSPK